MFGKPEGKRPLGRPWCRWEDNISMELREIRWEIFVWMHLVQEVDHWQCVKHGNEFGFHKNGGFLKWLSDY
jgi:hypothetical protein